MCKNYKYMQKAILKKMHSIFNDPIDYLISLNGIEYNYETWNFKLWLDNDQDLHNYIIGEIKKIKMAPDNGQDVTYETSNFLRSYIADNVPNLNVSTRSQSVHGSMSDKNGFYDDILNAALRDINTYEIAQSYLEDLHGSDWN